MGEGAGREWGDKYHGSLNGDRDHSERQCPQYIIY